MNIPEKHQLTIAKRTLRYAEPFDILVGIGKPAAREVLRRAGWSDKRIAKWEADGPPASSVKASQ